MPETYSNTYSEIYRHEGRYAGWPANYGMWSWGDELVLIFTSGYPDIKGGFHARDRSRPLITMQARSLDGGESWSVTEAPIPYATGLGAYEHMNHDVIESLAEIIFLKPDNVDFHHPDFAVMCGKTGLTSGAKSWFYTSLDRCLTWNGPHEIPMFDQLGIAARTDWIIKNDSDALLMLSATKPDGTEGRVFACRTVDGGKNFNFLSWINEFPLGYEIMPASLRLDNGDILCAIRCRGSVQDDCWIDLYISEDNASSWRYLGRPVAATGNGGNPGALVRLNDGRLVITFGSRTPPYGIFSVVSEDEGRSWCSPLILRESYGNHDIGYTRSVVRGDGKLVTAYYINDSPGGERFIEATITEF